MSLLAQFVFTEGYLVVTVNCHGNDRDKELQFISQRLKMRSHKASGPLGIYVVPQQLDLSEFTFHLHQRHIKNIDLFWNRQLSCDKSMCLNFWTHDLGQHKDNLVTISM